MCAKIRLPLLNHLNIAVYTLLDDYCLPVSKHLCVAATNLLGSLFLLVAREEYSHVGSSSLQLALLPHCLRGYMTQQPLRDCFFFFLCFQCPLEKPHITLGPLINCIRKVRSCSFTCTPSSLPPKQLADRSQLCICSCKLYRIDHISNHVI